jgi:hypothetical protein
VRNELQQRKALKLLRNCVREQFDDIRANTREIAELTGSYVFYAADRMLQRVDSLDSPREQEHFINTIVFSYRKNPQRTILKLAEMESVASDGLGASEIPIYIIVVICDS